MHPYDDKFENVKFLLKANCHIISQFFKIRIAVYYIKDNILNCKIFNDNYEKEIMLYKKDKE